MGRSRRNPKYLKYQKQKRAFSTALFSLFHGNPRGQEGAFRLDDGRIIATKDVPDPLSKARASVLSTRTSWQSDWHQGVTNYCSLIEVNDFYPSGLKRFFSAHGDKNFFMLRTEEFIYRSIEYSNKAIAMLSFKTGRITWIERTPSKGPVPPVP